MKEIRKLKLEELNRLEVEEFQKVPKIDLEIVLDNIRSGLNVGSVFRTSDAFRISRIYLCGITVTPPHKEILKTAIGANNSVDWEYVKDVSELLKKKRENGFKIIGIEQTTVSEKLENFEIDPFEKYILVFGNEVNGVSETALSHMDHLIEIPQYGTKHSLNISVCAGIVIHHFATKLLDELI